MILRGTPDDPMLAARIMDNYAEILTPWAEAVANSMLADVARRDEVNWFTVAKELGRGIRSELSQSPIGTVYQQRRIEQVKLITSLPTEAAARVRLLTQEMVSTGGRASTLAADLMATEGITRRRANLIARTEVAKAQSVFTQARAENIGSQAYTWLTSKDGDVRPSHRKMQGQIVFWNAPPTLDGIVCHAGESFNCRCVAVPILPE